MIPLPPLDFIVDTAAVHLVAPKRPDWVVVHEGTLGFECRRCGATDRVELPTPVSKWLACAYEFVKRHTACLEPADGATIGPPMGGDTDDA